MPSTDRNGNNNNLIANDHKKTDSEQQHATKIPKSRFPPFNNALSEDEIVQKKFIDNLVYKIDNKILTSPNQKEREIIRDFVFYPGFFVGCVVAAGSFSFLRRAPIYIMDKMAMHRYHYVNENIKHITREQNKLPQPFKEGPVAKSIGTIFDATLASLIGFVAWSLSVDKDKVFKSISEIPLMEGQSEISNALCTDFIDIYKNQVRPKFWKEYKDDSIVALATFVRNCEKRQFYQKKMRREKGWVDAEIEEMDLPSPVSDEMLEDDDDWAALDDFDEDLLDKDQK